MPADPAWTQIDRALDRALALDAEDRAAFVASLPPEIRAAVDRALSDDSLLDHPEVAHQTVGEPEPVLEGERLGPYVLDGIVGEGGMGRVYRARRADGAFDQTVAVKVVRQSLTLAGSDVAARLRRERDLLAALDHPGIARLIDGGETDDGVPYLVTEFVDGAPITTWADARALGVADRVRLMVEVARAIDHAHRRFVVHRDLKPSNVLVTEADGTARPVVLDFGIAKLLEAPDDDSSAFPLTRTGMRLLTPAYAAPELYDPTATVTTAADVYGLGALLYELLTGRRPHDDAPTGGAPTTEPTRPSRVVTEAGSGTNGTSGTVPDTASRSRALRGDLDVICLKALHPDPARRYDSAAELADDLGRHLKGLPVEARPDSRAYVVGRFVRRNRAAVAAGVVAVLALAVGLTSSLVSLANEREARVQAEDAAEQAQGSARFLSGVFDAANLEKTSGAGVTVREALDQSRDRIETVESPTLRVRLLTQFGRIYLVADESVTAESLLVRAVRTSEDAGVGGEPYAAALYYLGRLRGFENDFAAAEVLFRRGLAELDDSDLGMTRFNLTRDLAWIYRDLRKYEQSLNAAHEAVRIARLDPSTSSGTLPIALWEAGKTYASIGDLVEAKQTMRETVQGLERHHGRAATVTAMAMIELSWVYGQAGEWEEAKRLSQEAFDILRTSIGMNNSRTRGALISLAEAEAGLGRLDQAETHFDSSLAMAGRLFAPDDRRIGLASNTIANVRNQMGNHVQAERDARGALRIATLHQEGAMAGEARTELGIALAGQGRLDAARVQLRQAIVDLEGVGNAEADGSRPRTLLAELDARGTATTAVRRR